jgi:intergrase/recombinase
MEALAAYAKYKGCYEKWQGIRKQYSLKWTNGNDESISTLQRFFSSESLDSMLRLIRQMIENTPVWIGKIIRLGIVVGLRTTEIIESVRLINDKETFAKYYDCEQMTLCHYKFPKQFLRNNKKAWISFVTPDMLAPIQNMDKIPTYSSITHVCNRRRISCNLHLCRKIYATHLHQSGVPVEIIDAPQGRTPASIFAKHYYRPSLDYRNKVLAAVEQLQSQLNL